MAKTSLKITEEIEPGKLILCIKDCTLINDSLGSFSPIETGDPLLHLNVKILAKGIFRDQEEAEFTWLHLKSLRKVYFRGLHLSTFFCLMPEEI